MTANEVIHTYDIFIADAGDFCVDAFNYTT